MKKLTIPKKLQLRTETLRVLTDSNLGRVAGGLARPTISRDCCGDDSSGNGLLCPDFAPTTRV